MDEASPRRFYTMQVFWGQRSFAAATLSFDLANFYLLSSLTIFCHK
jgi:hypothetical protein